jgi:Protein of unknown function (DUF3102)
MKVILKPDTRVGFENPSRNTRQISIEEILAKLQDLFSFSKDIQKTQLLNAIKKGFWLTILKEQVKHGKWIIYLNELSINERTAQRLINLSKFEKQLKAEFEKRKQNDSLLTLTAAYRLVALWSKLNSGESLSVLEKTKEEIREEDPMSGFEKKLKNDTVSFLWKFSKLEVPKIINRLEADPEKFVSQVLNALREI